MTFSAINRLLFITALLLTSGTLQAQNQTLPDWSGSWEANFRDGGYIETPEYSEAGWAQINDYRYKRDNDLLPDSGDGINCIPIGMPDIMPSPLFLIEFYFEENKIVAYLEAYGMVRWIHTDGREIPADAIPAFMGYSTGHWEDDTLVVETGAIYEGTRMTIPVPLESGGTENIEVRHGPNLHLVERMHLIDENTMEIHTTISDPTLFAEPAETRYTYTRHRGREWEVTEYVCAQNNRAYLDEDGNQHMILSTDPE